MAVERTRPVGGDNNVATVKASRTRRQAGKQPSNVWLFLAPRLASKDWNRFPEKEGTCLQNELERS